ncbi:DNA repair endonuclease XPF-like [Paramacrobiotus metropolitanus]|uniref:DNA repair endonuclease XPF-like n=1 Tax=Paramacrobiotus metropolitanus TaxID=2943436 RepID=UPI0024464B07|nr:DNA repair endonuclease XPF-like [Paramacrobiotus metropolitanus]
MASVAENENVLLDYEKQIFLDCFHEDGLLVMAKGLGLERIFLSFLRIYCDPGQLVLVLNVSSAEEEYFINELRRMNVSPLPKSINNEIAVNARYSTYLQGGALFVSSRILVVDFLTDRVPAAHVSGILINRAHKVNESSQEAFILRLYRQKNTKGFIKAFTDTPNAFTQGFGRVERVMKNLFVRKLHIWPRFEASVLDTLDKHKPEVIELQLKMNARMRDIQMAVLDLISVCVKEVRRCNPTLDTEEITVENAISRSFEKVIGLYLDPVWHHLSQKNRQLIADLKVFRTLLMYLTSYDCLTFYNLVAGLRNRSSPQNCASSWIFLEPAEKLFILSQERVFGQPQESKEISMDVVEKNSKWQALQDVMTEIKIQNQQLFDSELGPGRTLILAADERCCSQLRILLKEGYEALINTILDRSTLSGKVGLKGSTKANKKRTAEKEDDQVTLTQMMKRTRKKGEETEPVEPLSVGDQWDLQTEMVLWSDVIEYETLSPSAVVFHPLFSSNEKAFEIVRVMLRFLPRYIVLYDLDMTVVRQIEVHKATHPSLPLRVYFVMYADSVEEQRYLTTLRIEKQAFEHLIREKGTMALPEDMTADLYRDVAFAVQLNTRQGGLVSPAQMEQPRVIVDMREFGSELPSLLHRRGIDIHPVTLEVGDYVLTPDICVERKSVNDLIGSLNSGRLYSQATQLTRFYRCPVLLIEFDQNKSFSLNGNYAKETTLKDVSNKLVLLTLHFPKLRILWCSSPYATAELFQEIKLGRTEPDPTKAVTVSSEQEATAAFEKYNLGPQEMLLKMPGVTQKNYLGIMNRVDSIAALCKLTEPELKDILGSASDAEKLHGFLHMEYEEKHDESNQRNKPKTKYRFGKRL